MQYIIDANNLAGKLGILFEDDFDKELVSIIKHYFYEKKISVFLVFDSNDLMGDRYTDGLLTVVYTPRDSFYKCADDKVVELLYEKIDNSKEEITLVTDDLEIIDKAKEIIKRTKTRKLFIERSTDFAIRIESKNIIEDGSKDDLNEDEIEKINDELLNLWTKK